MSFNLRNISMFAIMGFMFIAVGEFNSWSTALFILNFCLISAIMSMGVNIQWGYAGLLNVGIMGFVALGGMAATLVSIPPVQGAIEAGGSGIVFSAFLTAIAIGAIYFAYKMLRGGTRKLVITAISIVSFFVIRHFFDPAVEAIEAYDSAGTGNLGGLNMPIMFGWILGGILAAGAAWMVGKISLGLRSDYLAIATLGISEIIIAVLKNEDWLTRGVKNVNGLPRPVTVPYEVEIQQSAYWIDLAERWNISVVDLSSIVVKLSYAALFAVVLLIILYLSEKALNSPWGRMMRAIRDNETAAEAMGKDVTGRHLQVFILGSAVVGVAGAMLTTLDGLFTPTAYQPLRYTFLIWVMVIVGGSGNNWGAVLGGFVVGFFWIQAEPIGLWAMDVITSGMAEDSDLRTHLLKSAAHMRLMMMGVILLLVLRFTPKGLIPEK
jgi:branched-chain amino acid transport system permease protein